MVLPINYAALAKALTKHKGTLEDLEVDGTFDEFDGFDETWEKARRLQITILRPFERLQRVKLSLLAFTVNPADESTES